MNIGELCIRNTFIIRKDENIIEAAKLMRVFNVGDLIVVNEAKEGNTPVGILTDRDIVVRGLAEQRDPSTTQVKEIISSQVVSCSQEDSVEAAVKLMEEKKVRRLIVLDEENKPVGIISLGDIAVKTRQEELVGAALESISTPW